MLKTSDVHGHNPLQKKRVEDGWRVTMYLERPNSFYLNLRQIFCSIAFVQVPERSVYKPASTGEPGFELKPSAADDS